MSIILEAKTRKGRNIIALHGKCWTILREDSTVLCLNNKAGLLILAPDGDKRWIAKNNDDNFEIVEQNFCAVQSAAGSHFGAWVVITSEHPTIIVTLNMPAQSSDEASIEAFIAWAQNNGFAVRTTAMPNGSIRLRLRPLDVPHAPEIASAQGDKPDRRTEKPLLWCD